jgi:hypothetical protein
MSTTPSQASEQQIREQQNLHTQPIYDQIATVRNGVQQHILSTQSSQSALTTIKAQISGHKMTESLKKGIFDGESAMSMLLTNSQARLASADAFETNFRGAWTAVALNSWEQHEAPLERKFKELYEFAKGWNDELLGELVATALPLKLRARGLVGLVE